MSLPNKAWVKGGLWLAFFFCGLWLGLRLYGHQIWYSGGGFAEVVDNHLEITAISLLVCAIGAFLNIRLGLIVLFASQAVLSALTANLGRDTKKWEIPDLNPAFTDSHLAETVRVFQILCFISTGLLIAVAISLFWKTKSDKSPQPH